MEHLASVAGLSAAVLDDYVLGGWAHDVWQSRVRGAVEICLRTVSNSPGSASAADLGSQRRGTSSEPAVSLVRVGEHVEELIDMCEPGIWRNYARRWLETLGSSEKYRATHKTLTVCGSKLSRRAERVRNSLVHGNPADQGVVSSIRDISRYRAYTSLDIALESVSRGVLMSDELERRHELHAGRMRALKDGVSLVEHWRLGT